MMDNYEVLVKLSKVNALKKITIQAGYMNQKIFWIQKIKVFAEKI